MKATSPATAPTTAPAHPWMESNAPIAVAAPDPVVSDVVAVDVLMTLSVDVAKILRDFISSRDESGLASG